MRQHVRMNSFLILATVSVLFCTRLSHSAWADLCDWDIEVQDGMSGKVSHYRPGSSWLNIDIADFVFYSFATCSHFF